MGLIPSAPAASAAVLAAPRDTDTPARIRSVAAGGLLAVALPALTVCAVGLQIGYPLTHSSLRDHLTVLIVVAFALVCVAHVAVTRGVRRAVGILAVTAVPGYLVEVVGVSTGFPFGSYRYSDVIGPRLLEVPLVVGLAWTMLCWPAALVARRLATSPAARVVLGAWATTAGDLFLDPQMVAAGGWTWNDPGMHLPGVPDVPLSNYAGWLLVTLVLSALVQATMGDGNDDLGIGLYLWFWIAWTLALALFLGLPAVALWGAAAMGTVAVPVLVGWARTARPARRPDRQLVARAAPAPAIHRTHPLKGSCVQQSSRVFEARSSAAVAAAPAANGGTGQLAPSTAEGPGWGDRIAEHVAEVESMLIRELDDLCCEWDRDADNALGPYSLNPPAQLRQLLDRGGKRTRPVMTLLGWMAADVQGSGRGHDDMMLAAAALEMLHCFALVHDDVMDESPTRRGVLTVHESAARLHAHNAGRGSSARFGDSIGVLVGDLAHSEADRLAASLPEPMRRVWREMVLELIAGQLRDVVGSAAADRRIGFARMVARQKTGYYTVARPLQLGAIAAGADSSALAALRDYGRHAGEAFALRDDVLGVYGDPQVTGKPAGDDIRSGKPTVLLALASETLTGRAATALRAAGSTRMTDTEVGLVQNAMVDAGVVADVEAMIDERVADATSALRLGELSANGVAQLTRVVGDLARRGR